MSDAIDHPVKASNADASAVACQTFGVTSGNEPGTRRPKARVGKPLVQQIREIKTTMKKDFEPAIGCEACANALKGSEVHFDPLQMFRVLEVIDTFDRPGSAFAIGPYAAAETYAHAFENKPGKRIPKAGASAAAGVGLTRAEWSVFEAEAKGPNACAGAEASVALLGAEAGAQAGVGSALACVAGILEVNAKGPNASAGVGASLMCTGAFARAQLGSVSVSAGPLRGTLGLSVDTGASIGLTGVEVKILGTGFSAGPRTGVTLLGNGFECNIM